MFAIQFISQDIFPLKRSDSAESAAIFMEDWQVKELPVVESAKVIGLVNYAMAIENEGKRVDEFMLSPEPYLAYAHLHVWEVQKKLNDLNASLMFLQDTQQAFTGVITLKDIAQQSYAHSAIMQQGAILVLEIEAIQYSLAELARICEANDAKIIQLMIEPIKGESNLLQISIKLSTDFPSHVIASLERFSYRITYSNGNTDPNHSLEDRYKWLVKYLNT
jgi:signal-transduction protein with cAMP-binding, CBS, and nucleotidyltransferase domain